MKYPKLFILSAIVLLLCTVRLVVYKFDNPDMTSTRQFLNMWGWNVAAFVGMVGFYLFINWKK